MAAAQLAGEDFLVGLDRCAPMGPAGDAGAGPAASTATGLARRFTPEHWRGAEAAWRGRPPGWWACCPPSGRLSWRKGR